MENALSKINNPSCSFEDVVSDPIIARLYRQPNSSVQKYFKSHSFELLKYSLSHANTAIENNSFNIIIYGDPDILMPMLKNDEFLNLALDIVNKNDVEPYVLGRLSTIMLTALLVVPELAMETFGFIYHLLPHCGNPSVLYFFITIVSNEPQFSPTQKWLLEMGFFDYLLRELNSIDYSYNSTESNVYFDETYEKVFSLYQILSKCASNPIMVPDLLREDLIEILSMDFKDPPVYVENARWNTILQLTTRETSEMMYPIVPRAIKAIETDVKKLPAYIVTALEMVNLMMDYSPRSSKFVFKSNMLLNLLNLVNRFMNSTILLKAFRNFVEVCLRFNDDFVPKMVSLLLPFVMDFATTRQNRVLAPFCFSILELFVESEKRNPKVTQALNEEAGCREFLKGKYKIYMKNLHKEYGNETKLSGLFRAFI